MAMVVRTHACARAARSQTQQGVATASGSVSTDRIATTRIAASNPTIVCATYPLTRFRCRCVVVQNRSSARSVCCRPIPMEMGVKTNVCARVVHHRMPMAPANASANASMARIATTPTAVLSPAIAYVTSQPTRYRCRCVDAQKSQSALLDCCQRIPTEMGAKTHAYARAERNPILRVAVIA